EKGHLPTRFLISSRIPSIFFSPFLAFSRLFSPLLARLGLAPRLARNPIVNVGRQRSVGEDIWQTVVRQGSGQSSRRRSRRYSGLAVSKTAPGKSASRRKSCLGG